MRYFEDIVVGERIESTGSFELTEDEIVSFCRKWDPLPFHTDPAAAARTPMGKLFTSAIHTIAIGANLMHSAGADPVAVLAGLGWDEVRFVAPACVGDRLTATTEVIEARPSEGKSDRGIVRYFLEVKNEHGKTVASFKTSVLVWRRGAEGAPKG